MTVDEAEQPAKQWQVNDINKQLTAMNKKIDKLLDVQSGFVTHTEASEMIKVEREFQEGKHAELRAKYDPIVKLFWTLIGAVVVEMALIVLQIANKV